MEKHNMRKPPAETGLQALRRRVGVAQQVFGKYAFNGHALALIYAEGSGKTPNTLPR